MDIVGLFFASVVLILFFLCSLLAAFWLCAQLRLGLFFPETNKEYVVLQGEFPVKYIRDKITYIAERANPADTTNPNAKVSWKVTTINFEDLPIWQQFLYNKFGIRCYGIPLIYKLADIVVNYPPQIRSASGLEHEKNTVVPALDIHHNYLLYLKDVDFQGGIKLTLKFSFETTLVFSFVAYGRNGSFLDPLGQYAEGAVKSLAIEIPATDFIGKTFQKIDVVDRTDDQKNVVDSKVWRDRLCKEVMALNLKTNSGSEKPEDDTPLPELCGYKIRSISYNDYIAEDESSKSRLKLLEDQYQEQLKIEIEASKKKQALQIAEAEAAVTRAEGLAEADVEKAKGLAEADVDKAKGLADVAVLEAKTRTIGKDVILREIDANAWRDGVKGFQGDTLFLGNGSGPQPVFQIAPKSKDASSSDTDKNDGDMPPTTPDKPETPQK